MCSDMNQPMTRRSAHDVGDAWTTVDATEMYEIARWGQGYFSIGENGHVKIHPTKETDRSIDLKQLVDHLQLRGISLPTLVRFRDILRHRLQDIHEAFQAAITQHEYTGNYVCVYPIKVNQQRQVVEEVFNFGKPFKFGLEAGSKPELIAVAAIADNDTPIICNGFKDAEFIELAMLAQKLGRNIIPVVEKYTELDLILEHRRAHRRAAEDRHARQAGGARRRPVAVIRRIPLEVRAHGRRNSAGAQRAEDARDGRLPAAAPLPPRQPDSQHPHRQGRAQRGGARLRGAGAGRRGPEIHGRRRRSRRRLRRLADQLRIERQLHAAGIRQRRRLSPADGVRRSEGGAPDDHLRKRARHRGASQPARVQRAGRVGLRHRRSAGGGHAGNGAAARRSHRDATRA